MAFLQVQNLENNKDVTHIASSDETKYKYLGTKGLWYPISLK